MAKYELLVDGKGHGKVDSDDAVRSWLRTYRDEHEEDDPDATHVQVRQLSGLAWLTGGKLIPREQFFAER